MSSNQFPAEPRAGAVLLDVEGTTTPKEFVYDVLFPFARRHLRDFVREHRDSEEVLACVEGLRAEHRADVQKGLGAPAWREGDDELLLDSVSAYVNWLMDADRKSTALKSLQGKIWEAGYLDGSLRAPVYGDVPRAFARWRGQGRGVYIYSSGSVHAQKLLFSHTTEGDLTALINGYFDTAVGAKTSADSYRAIATRIGRPAAEILFLSDVTGELDAARDVGMKTGLCLRAGDAEPPGHAHPVVETFDGVLP